MGIYYDRDIEIVKRCQINKMKRGMNVRGMSPKTIRQALESIKKIHDNPHICTRCWTGTLYLDGELICDCDPKKDEETAELIKSGQVVLDSKVDGVEYYKRK